MHDFHGNWINMDASNKLIHYSHFQKCGNGNKDFSLMDVIFKLLHHKRPWEPTSVITTADVKGSSYRPLTPGVKAQSIYDAFDFCLATLIHIKDP